MPKTIEQTVRDGVEAETPPGRLGAPATDPAPQAAHPDGPVGRGAASHGDRKEDRRVIPGGRGNVQPFEPAHPLPLDPKGDGVGQVLVEVVLRRLHVLEAGEVVQVVAERLPLPLLLRSGGRPLGHEGSEAPDDDHRDDGAEQEVPPAADVGKGEDGGQHAQHHRRRGSRNPANGHAPLLGLRKKSPAVTTSVVDLPDDGLNVGVEVVPQLFGGHLVRMALSKSESATRQLEPLRSSRGFVRVKMVSGRAVAAVALGVGDLQVAASGQVDDGGDDLFGVDLLVDQGAHQARRQLGRRLAHVATHRPRTVSSRPRRRHIRNIPGR